MNTKISQKKIIYKILEWDTAAELELKVQSEINHYINYTWFLMKVDTIITPINSSQWCVDDLRYTATLHLSYND